MTGVGVVWANWIVIAMEALVVTPALFVTLAVTCLRPSGALVKSKPMAVPPV